MRAFIITSVCFAAFGGFIRLLGLAVLDYPRNTKGITRGEDVFAILVVLAWCAWGWHLLSI